MALLVKKSTSNALLDLLSRRSETPQKSFTPVFAASTPSEDIPWRVRWWPVDALPSVFIPATGAVADMTVEDTYLTPSSKEDHESAIKPVSWYKASTTGSSSISDGDSVWAILSKGSSTTKTKVTLIVSASQPSKTYVSNTTHVIQLAIIHFIDHPDGTDEVVVDQCTIGMLRLSVQLKFYLPGPIEFITVSGKTYLGQRWMKLDGDTLAFVTSASDSSIPRVTTSTSTTQYAALIPLYGHASDHTDGVVTVRTEI